MEIFIELLKYILPSGFVFVATYFVIKKTSENELFRKRIDTNTDIKLGNQKYITPLRLQAYERMALFLERIMINNLLMRVNQNGINARMLHTELLRQIRTEFEHNLSVQIYLSPELWTLIKQAKDETIKTINVVSGKINEDATAIELSKSLLELVGSVDKQPAEYALELLKAELRKNF